MEALLILLALALAAIPFAVIYLLVSNADLKRRVKALEAQQRAVPQIETPETEERQVDAAPPPEPKAAKAPSPGLIAATKSQPSTPPKAVVFTTERLQALTQWLTQNWFYAVSAVSLALAGIFLVIYGMEQGLLPPKVRVLAAFAFGAVLIGAGEYIRRRFGDDADVSTAYLPSTFSGAGIITLFGSVLSARLLYDFIDPTTALFAMAAIGIVALVLGWFYGPLLAATGILGAMVSPFIIGGSSDTPSFLLIYFATVTLVGLGIDTIRRWAWVSVLSLVLGYGAGTLLTLGFSAYERPYFIIYCLALTLAAIAIPVRKWLPDHGGTLLSLTAFARKNGDPWPEFPTRLAGGAVIAASILITLFAVSATRPDLFWSGVLGLGGLILAILVWGKRADALVDLAFFPAGGLIAVTASGDAIWLPHAQAALEPEASMPKITLILVALGLLVSAAAAWRSLQGGAARLYLALGAAVLAPALAIGIEVFWQPAEAIGGYFWALHAMLIAAAMAFMAERFARADGPEDRNRASFAALSALACIAFAMVILFSTAALTIAIAITIVAAAWMDRQFNLPLMGLYILAGVAAVGYRLVVDPGFDWASDAPLPEMLLSHAGAVAAFGAAYLLARSAKRPRSQVVLESAAFSSLGILLSLLLYRAITAVSGQADVVSHWSAGIGATIWIMLGLAQLRRYDIGGRLAKVRGAFGLGFLTLGGLFAMAAVTALNPLFFAGLANDVIGPIVINSLLAAYLLPAAALGFGAWWLKGVPKLLRSGFVGSSLVLLAIWFGLLIRHFWRGAGGMALPGIDQPELYSYTVVLLLLGAGLFYQSLAKKNALLRKAGLVVIGLAVAKVFFIDIQGLGGLIRVFSLLFLGLALAGLAWLNRWAAAQTTPDEIPQSGGPK